MKPQPTRQLPDRPDLDHLRRQAKELLGGFLASESAAVAEVDGFYRKPVPDPFALHHAQLVLARSYGFDSWPKLKAYVDGATISRLVQAVRAGDVQRVRSTLQVRPELVNREAPASHGYQPLHYAVLGRLTEIVRVLMEFGADPRAGTAGIYALREAASPLVIAEERGYDEIASVIREVQSRRDTGRSVEETAVEDLQAAFEERDEAAAIEVLNGHPDLIGFRMPGNRWSLLHAASALLLNRVVSWLLDRGADPKSRADDGSTPIDVAGASSYFAGYGESMAELVRLMLIRGAEPTPRSAVAVGDEASLRRMANTEDLLTPRDDRGWLLRLAVDCYRADMLRLLLDLGLDPDARVRVEDDDEITYTWGMPLYQCARYGKHAMAEMLLERGADPNGQVYASGTPLSEAYGQRDERMVALLERFGGKPNASMAGLYRRADLAERLLQEFGDADLPADGFAKGPVAEQLLGAAARGGDPAILRMAMERVHFPHGHRRWNELLQGPIGFWNHWFGPWCHHEWDRSTYLTCFRMILERSGAPNAGLNCGSTILHQIVVMGDHVTSEERISFASAALDAGARTDVRDDLLRSTPLGWACRWGREELVRLFLARGADPVEMDAEAWARPIAWAEKKGHRKIAAMLQAAAS